MTLPNTCASGRNSSTEPPALSSSGRMAAADLMSDIKPRWVSSQPLGRPVVPEV
jgi:hypothetical protein